MSPKPMLTEDYLIRQINLAIAALAKILGLKTAGQFQAALYEIDQLLEQLIGLRSYMIKNLSDEGILAILSNAEGVDTDRLLIVADLIKHEGDILAEKKYAEESAGNYARALNFFLEVQLSGGPRYLDPPDAQIEEMLNQLTSSEFPAETLFNLYLYFEQKGEYARSEEMLSRVAGITGWQEDLIKEHEDFYGRLLERPDQEIELGGLSRFEVERKVEQLQAMAIEDNRLDDGD
ncbi:MAG TPA: DUF6483 family protein [Anaerolineales bacterium]